MEKKNTGGKNQSEALFSSFFPHKQYPGIAAQTRPQFLHVDSKGFLKAQAKLAVVYFLFWIYVYELQRGVTIGF